MRNVLLLTDFSRNSANAISYAMHLFKDKKSSFYLMHVHKARSYITDDLLLSPKNSIHDSIVKVPKAKLDAIVKKLQNDYKDRDYQFQSIVDYDIFTDAINQVIKNFDINYLIMGSNGASNVKEILFGSNTINVIEKVNCKTIVIPSNYNYVPIKNMLVTLQPEDALNAKIFDAILDFIEDFKMKLHVIRMSSRNDDLKVIMQDRERLALLDSKYYLVQDVPLNYAISSYIQTNQIDMTVFITQEKSFLERSFSASIRKELISRMKLPLLVLHQRKRLV